LSAATLPYYNCFNVAQCDNIPAPDAPVFTPTAFSPIEAAEAIMEGYRDGPAIVYGGSQALYRLSTDTIHMPKPARSLNKA
jgi:antirestriction protein ArdC